MNFDDVVQATYALFQVATGAGWSDVMLNAVDARGPGLVPQKNSNPQSLLFFLVFTVVGCFVILNLFVGILVDQMQATRMDEAMDKEVNPGDAEGDTTGAAWGGAVPTGGAEAGAAVPQSKWMLSEEEQVWARIQNLLLADVQLRRYPDLRDEEEISTASAKRASTASPQVPPPPKMPGAYSAAPVGRSATASASPAIAGDAEQQRAPPILERLRTWARRRVRRVRRRVLIVVEHSWFEFAISGFILLNTMTMCARRADMPPELEQMIDSLNLGFAMVFTLECAVRLLAFGRLYFDDAWNKFDFTVVLGTNTFLLLEAVSGGGAAIGALAPAVRSFRIARLLRLARSMKGLQMMFKTLFAVIPNLVNTSCLMIMIFYIYAILSMGLLSTLMPGGTITDRVHFRSFGTAMLSWIGMATGMIWEELLFDCMRHREGCLPTNSQTFEDLMHDGPQECGNPMVAFPIFVSYQCLVALVVMNLFVGVVLESFGAEMKNDFEELEQAIAEFLGAWSQVNMNAERMMSVPEFVDLLLTLPDPVGFKAHQIAATREGRRKIILREICKSAPHLPLWECNPRQKGTYYLHIRDAMVYITRRCCAYWTRPLGMDMVSTSPPRVNRVAIGRLLLGKFSIRFPEFTPSGNLRERNGKRSQPPTLVLLEYLAVATMQRLARKFLARIAVHRVRRSVRLALSPIAGAIEPPPELTARTHEGASNSPNGTSLFPTSTHEGGGQREQGHSGPSQGGHAALQDLPGRRDGLREEQQGHGLLPAREERGVADGDAGEVVLWEERVREADAASPRSPKVSPSSSAPPPPSASQFKALESEVHTLRSLAKDLQAQLDLLRVNDAMAETKTARGEGGMMPPPAASSFLRSSPGPCAPHSHAEPSSSAPGPRWQDSGGPWAPAPTAPPRPRVPDETVPPGRSSVAVPAIPGFPTAGFP